MDDQEPNDHGAAPAEPLDFDTWAALLDLDEAQRLALLAEVGIIADLADELRNKAAQLL